LVRYFVRRAFSSCFIPFEHVRDSASTLVMDWRTHGMHLFLVRDCGRYKRTDRSQTGNDADQCGCNNFDLVSFFGCGFPEKTDEDERTP
jgi:photosystem II stability/assembly factor-like uncharacterized protein